MSRLYFEKFADVATPELRAAVETLLREYETGGPCTHVGFPGGTGEVIFVFPTPEEGGERFVAVASPDELASLEAGTLRGGVDECYLEATDEALEDDGLETKLSFF
jgi:hypothetical protein